MRRLQSILSFGALLACLPPVAAQEKPAPARIAVVKTWKDLQNLPPIDLGDGVKIRVGLEAAALPQWSGAFLYCLTEGYTPPNDGAGQAPFGPVHADFAFDDGKNREELAEKMRWGREKKEWQMGSYLFVRDLMVDRVGTYRVRVIHPKGQVLAEAMVTGTKDFFHPWMPWLEGYPDHVAPEKGIALPNADTFGPVAFVEAGKIKTGNLPTYLPDGGKPSLVLALQGEEFVIRSKTKFTASRPERHFLARWWVNDKPFVPKQITKFWLTAGYGRAFEEDELRLPVLFRPERLGAKAGDKIGLQLLHCENGWHWCTDSDLVYKWSRADGEHLRLSNRIDFIAREPKKKP